jgi:hypothetical protein
VTPFGRRVATFMAACFAFDLYGYAVYHAWRTHLLGSVSTLVLLTLMAVLGIAGLALAPAWLKRSTGAAATPAAIEQPAAVEQSKPRPWWFAWVLVLASIAGGVGLAAWSWLEWPPATPPTAVQSFLLIALDTACVGFLVFTIVRLRRPERFGLALGVILTIDGAVRLVGGIELARILSLKFVFGIIQMGVIYMPLCLWGGYLWRRIMTAIFTPPRR